MSEQWTPTTDQVRSFYAHDSEDEYHDPIAYPSHVRSAEQAFDRRLDSLASQIFETAALMSDDDIAEMLDTIANEKDVKMAEYKLPAEPDGPPVKVGDTGLTAEQVWGLPKGSVIWPERAEDPEPWMRYGDRWESISEFAGDAGELQCECGDRFTVLRLGGGEE